MAFGYWLEAEYSTGYVHREDDQDHSPYVPGRNIWFDILHGKPTEAGHGPMVRLSLIGDGVRYDIDWTALPDDARPIYYRTMERTITQTPLEPWEDSGPQCLAHFFGYQHQSPDGNGSNVQHIEEIH